jgi:hypothetical protein
MAAREVDPSEISASQPSNTQKDGFPQYHRENIKNLMKVMKGFLATGMNAKGQKDSSTVRVHVGSMTGKSYTLIFFIPNHVQKDL